MRGQYRSRRAAVLAVAGLALAAAGVAATPARSTHADNPRLDAIVGTNDGFDIGLFFPSGERVATLQPGTYTIVVHDRSALHNFHMASNFDGGVDIRTDVEFVGDKTFTVTFKPGILYAYACEPHWQTMNGSFRTLADTSTTTTTTTPPPTPIVRADVSPGGRVTVRPTSVTAGRLRLVVRDRSTHANFHLAGPGGVNRKTGKAFAGTRTWSLRLARGTYRFGSDPAPLRGILRAR